MRFSERLDLAECFVAAHRVDVRDAARKLGLYQTAVVCTTMCDADSEYNGVTIGAMVAAIRREVKGKRWGR